MTQAEAAATKNTTSPSSAESSSAPPRDATNHPQPSSNSNNKNKNNRGGPHKQPNKNNKNYYKKKNNKHHHKHNHTVGIKDNNSTTATTATTTTTTKDVVERSSSESSVDPRGFDPSKRMTKAKKGRNTESFDPKSTLVRPALRIQIGSPLSNVYKKPLKHDDVVIVPELFGPEDDFIMYNQLLEEMKQLQDSNIKGSEYIAWHEGAHLIIKNPKGSPTFTKIINRLCDYFHIDNRQSIGTRFNWYKDSLDWKPFHHDSAAFNPQRAKSQNITVGVSFGATRELSFLRANEIEEGGGGNGNNINQQCRLYFPQPNNGVFSFGRDCNIHWKHGINALSEEEIASAMNASPSLPQGRISIILWGLATNVIEEDGSPQLLGSDGNGPHASNNNNNNYFNKNRGSNSNNNKNRHHHHQRGGGGRTNNNHNKEKQQGGGGNNNKENLHERKSGQ